MASDLTGVVVCVEHSGDSGKNEEKNEYSCSGILLSAKHGIVLTSASILTNLRVESDPQNGKTRESRSNSRDQNKETERGDVLPSRVATDLGGRQNGEETDVIDFDFELPDLPCLSFSVITTLGDPKPHPNLESTNNTNTPTTESAFRLVKHWKYELEPWVLSMEKPGYLKMPAQILGMWKFGELERHLNRILRDSVTVSEPDSQASAGDGESTLRKLMSSFLLLQIHPSPLSSLSQNESNMAKTKTTATTSASPIANKTSFPILTNASASLMKQDCRSAIVERFTLPSEVTRVVGQNLYTLTNEGQHAPIPPAGQQQSLEYRNLKMKALYEIVREAWTSTAAVARGQVVWSESSLFGDLSPSIFMNSLSRGVVVNTHGPLIITDARCAPGSEGGILFAQQTQSQNRLWVGIIFAPLSWKQSDLIGFTLACSARPLLADLLQKCRCLPFPQPAPPLGYCATPLTAGMWSVVLVKVGTTWGSGIVIDRAARLVLTCAHVVKGANTVLVKVEYPVAQTLKCQVLYQTPAGEALDLALLKLPTEALVEQAVYKPKGPSLGYCATPLTAGMWSVVLVKVGTTWGSGIVIDRAARLVLTCAHVVKGANTVLVKVEYPVAQTLKCQVLYQTPAGEALDLALLKLPTEALVEQAVYKPKGPSLGEEVFAIGHAVFPDYCKTGVLVTSGVVSKVVSRAQVPVLMQTTCAVYAGASGGAVVAADSGVLLGMVTCNSRDLTSSTTYPHINLAIPLIAVMPIIQEYTETHDVRILSKLHFKGNNIKELWNITNNVKGLSRL